MNLQKFSLLDPAVQQCPYSHYEEMRNQQPVFFTEVAGTPIYLISRYSDILRILKDHKTFSSRFGGSNMPVSAELAKRITELRNQMGGYERINTMLAVDPPEHERYRKLVSRAFTPNAISDLEPMIRGLCCDLIDGFIKKGKCEFVKEFAIPVPVTVIARALNVPENRLNDFKRWSVDATAGTGTDITDEERLSAEKGVIEFQHFFAEQLEIRRKYPKEDILTNLLTAKIDKNEDPNLPDTPLTMPEILGTLRQILVAGNETTTKLLTETVRLLAEHPEHWNRLRKNPEVARPTVEEALRFTSPTQGMWRITTKTVEIGDTPIPEGSRIFLLFGSANRDSFVFEDPDIFNPERSDTSYHLAFGKGIHYCLGANLSRLETRVALEELSRRISSISLSETNNFEYHPSFMLRGLTKLDLEFIATS
tara:strand:- start:3887 stop:5155 length:1269 start_codon:yes stop_codon:yes gene_type:complete